MGRSERNKGARVEREIAQMMGGKRMVMSGGSNLGGGDLTFAPDSIFADFLWEIKARKKIPEIAKVALLQAQVAIQAEGARKKPAGIYKEDGGRPIMSMYLDDFVCWAQALAETGQGMKARAILRQVRRQLDELENSL